MNKLTKIHWFFIKVAAIYVLWRLFDYSPLAIPINDSLNTLTTQSSVALLNVVGTEATMLIEKSVTPERIHLINLIAINGVPRVHIEDGCNGLTLIVLFAGFILAYPGKWQLKLWFIPLGMLLIYGINTVRMVALALNHYHNQSSFEFNHKYTFLIIVYAFIFGLWMLWINKLAKNELKSMI